MTDINVCKCIRCEMLKFQTELELCIIIDAKMIVDDKGENPKEKKLLTIVLMSCCEQKQLAIHIDTMTFLY